MARCMVFTVYPMLTLVKYAVVKRTTQSQHTISSSMYSFCLQQCSHELKLTGSHELMTQHRKLCDFITYMVCTMFF